MQTNDRSGISCDHCGTTYRNDFIYYSFDFKYATVADGRLPSLDMLHHIQTTFSLDICTACFADISQSIISNYAKLMSPKKGRVAHICELTGKMFSGTYNYYYCVVTKANVKLTGQPNICVKCQKKAPDATKPCACGGTSYVRPAAIHTDGRFLEFNLSEEAFVALRKKAEEIRKAAGNWSTSS